EGLVPFASKDSPERAVVRAALEASGVAVGRFLVDLRDGRPKRRGFSKGWETHLSYFVAHESHHRGSILLTLKVSGHAEPKAVATGIWSWDTM
ncbi:MAG: DinB family protein, partial [Rubricoccaceae bacterium]|nr:DinB family protein [Rubricoccaceae bacterium]